MGLLLRLGPLCNTLRILAGERGEERVGYLLGRQVGDVVEANAYYAAENIEHSPHSFTVNPLDTIAAHRVAWLLGLDVVAIYHTHPYGEPVPSARDLEGMRSWPLLWVIGGGLEGGLGCYLPGGRPCRHDCG